MWQLVIQVWDKNEPKLMRCLTYNFETKGGAEVAKKEFIVDNKNFPYPFTIIIVPSQN
jgi:hypothetical protein